MHENLRNIKHLFATIKHYYKDHPILKFIVLIIIIIVYLSLTIRKFGGEEGFMVSIITWSFFVLCTPIADAGFLIDLPIRIFTGIKMMYSEIIVWVIAITINIIAITTNPSIYQDTIILSIFEHILKQPIPYWSIIILSGLGTFFSLLFGDEIIDISYKKKDRREHHEKHKPSFNHWRRYHG